MDCNAFMKHFFLKKIAWTKLVTVACKKKMKKRKEREIKKRVELTANCILIDHNLDVGLNIFNIDN